MNNQQVPFFVVLLLTLIGMQNPSHSVVTLVLQADLQEFLCRCYSNPSQINSIHENVFFNPGVSIVSAQRPNSNLYSMFMQATGRDFQHGSNFCLFGSILLVVMIHLIGRAYSRQATVLYCVRSPVSFVMKYCPTSTTLINPASMQIFSIFLVVKASQFVLHIVAIEDFDSLGHHNSKELLS